MFSRKKVPTKDQLTTSSHCLQHMLCLGPRCVLAASRYLSYACLTKNPICQNCVHPSYSQQRATRPLAFILQQSSGHAIPSPFATTDYNYMYHPDKSLYPDLLASVYFPPSPSPSCKLGAASHLAVLYPKALKTRYSEEIRRPSWSSGAADTDKQVSRHS